MTVLENITYAPKHIAHDHSAKETAEQLLDALNISKLAYSFPQQLSGGQKQRVALARTLAMHPDLLLCDEPTSGLDVISTEDVVSVLRKVQAMGVTLLIASHHLSFLTEIADRIVILHAGHLAADLKPDAWANGIDTFKQYYQ